MKHPAFLSVLLLALFAAAFPAIAADQPAATTATGEKIYAPTELDAFMKVLGKKITVEGTLVRSGESKTKTVRYLNFTHNFQDSIALVFFISKDPDGFSKEKLREWVGKKVRVTGKAALYEERLQIEIEKWDQIQEIP